MSYIIRYSDRSGLNRGEYIVKTEKGLESALFTIILGRIGTSRSYSSFTYEEGVYTVDRKQGYPSYQGVFSLADASGKTIPFPKSIHSKLLNN